MDSRNRVAFMAGLELGKHAVFFYQNADDKHHMLFTFIQRGVEEGLQGRYLWGRQRTKGNKVCNEGLRHRRTRVEEGKTSQNH